MNIYILHIKGMDSYFFHFLMLVWLVIGIISSSQFQTVSLPSVRILANQASLFFSQILLPRIILLVLLT